MDGVTLVQSRIAEIQARFQMPIRQAGTSSSANWASAAAAAGLDGSGAVSDYGASGATASESAVVSEAQKYLGVPYLWGGTDPSKGLDCSGFVQLVYGNLGIDLPRVSSQQATAGRAVASIADARPGAVRPRGRHPLLSLCAESVRAPTTAVAGEVAAPDQPAQDAPACPCHPSPSKKICSTAWSAPRRPCRSA